MADSSTTDSFQITIGPCVIVQDSDGNTTSDILSLVTKDMINQPNGVAGTDAENAVMHPAGSQSTSVTYAQLPTNPSIGFTIFCSDAYSKLRENNDTTTGIMVTWNGTVWVDSLGIAAQH